MSVDVYSIILAGGKGERFWPMSTALRPKQLLALVDKRPMILAAVEHISSFIPLERILVITRQELVESICSLVPSLPAKNIIGEPCGRDTAAAIALGAALVKARNNRAVIAVLTADHVIGEMPTFQSTLSQAAKLACSADVLVTIGICPKFPSTGFGYIEAGEPLSKMDGIEFFKVKQFIEKPDDKTAKKYMETGTFYWNSGMFVFSVETFQKAVKTHCSWLMDLMKRIEPVTDSSKLNDTLRGVYPELKKVSIDYALMEKANNLVMAKGTFPWDDLGCWTALENHFVKDANQNAIAGNAECINSSKNIIVSEGGLIAAIGVDNLVIVQSGSTTLVCPKKRAQDVKKLVAQLKSKAAYKNIL